MNIDLTVTYRRRTNAVSLELKLVFHDRLIASNVENKNFSGECRDNQAPINQCRRGVQLGVRELLLPQLFASVSVNTEE